MVSLAPSETPKAGGHGARLAAVAVVVPVFRHSVLVAEALGSALDQEAACPIRVVGVNDGCPHAETDAALTDFARAESEAASGGEAGRFLLLRTPNRGLSAARNHAVAAAFRRWPETDAIYFLDADNRLKHGAIRRAAAALEAAPEAAWVSPSIDMFGLRRGVDYGGPFSRLAQAAMNPCEAGSLVRRSVFDAGIRFDETMRLGFEDWDFFLSAAAAGFSGINLDDLGLAYRKRPESMLSGAHRDQARIRAAMADKHRAIETPRMLMQSEAAEAPRYAITASDRGEIALTLDPDHPGQMVGAERYEQMVWAARTAPGREHMPPFLVSTTRRVVERLAAARMLHGLFWRLEDALDRAEVATLRLERSGHGVSLTQMSEPGGRQVDADLVMVGPALIDRLIEGALSGEGSAALDSIVLPEPAVSVAHFELGLDDGLSAHREARRHSPVHGLLSLLHGVGRSDFAAAAMRGWDWRANGMPARRERYRIVRAPFGGHAVFPRLAGDRQDKANGRQIAFVLQLLSFGGVERTVINIADALRDRGWVPHLVLAGEDRAAIDEDWRRVFATISFLGDPGQASWQASARFFGTGIPDWADTADGHGRAAHDRAAGLMAGFDVVVNCHGAGVHGLMAQLRRHGTKTVCALHLTDRSEHGRPVGHPYLGLAYEHAYDVVTTCSSGLADWCHGMGIPEEKLVVVPNAPGHALPAAVVERARERRQGSSQAEAAAGAGRLTALYVGRLDRQKGLDTLADIMALCDALPAAPAWRVVGRPVIDRPDAIPPRVARVMEAPMHDPVALSRLYLSADVLVLPSLFEGLPLTVLEAMRLGVVPIVSDVGALREVVRDGETGYLFPPDAGFAQAAAARISALTADRARLREIAGAAQDAMAGRSWAAAVADFDAALRATDREDT